MSVIRPSSALPNPPYGMGTRFYPVEDVELMPDNEFILNFLPYSAAKKTVFIVHGFTDSHQVEWPLKAKDSLLEQEDVNKITVDWAPGACSNYLKATANARLCGAQLYRFQIGRAHV